jgi:hypothetical protein
MKLKVNHNIAEDNLIGLLKEGYNIYNKINKTYQTKRASGTFDQINDIEAFSYLFSGWIKSCFIEFKNIFPTDIEANNFNTEYGSALRISGENMKFGSIRANFEGKLKYINLLRKELNNYESPLKLEIFIESIDSFYKAKNINPREVKDIVPLDLYEDTIQSAFEEIIGENFHQIDYGGEMNDLHTSHLTINGQRFRSVFMLKGKGTKGKLTISKCGKNGDQIIRLTEADATVFIIQHVNEIDQRVIYDLKGKIELKNRKGNRCHYCIIDGTDTAKILRAYNKI